MSARRRWAAALALFQGRRLERELENEILGHLELAEQDYRSRGMTEEEARRAARVRFGGVEKMKEEHRDQRSARVVEIFLRDLRLGFHQLRRQPSFSFAVIAVLALGIGINVAMFSVVDAVILKPLPFPDAGRIVRIWEAPRPGSVNDTSTLDFLDWRAMAAKEFEAMAAEQWVTAALTGAGEPTLLRGKNVSADYFKVFAVKAAQGRTFGSSDDQAGSAPPIVLSHAAWQTYFGGASDILSQQPVLDGRAHRIVAVLPPGVFDRDPVQFWRLLVFTPEQRTREMHWLTVHGRLRAGVALESATARLESIRSAIAEAQPAQSRESTSAMVARRLSDLLTGGSLRDTILVSFGAVVLVLLIASANVANLLLARGIARKKEIAVRTALGASRGRLVAQLLTESLALCMCGGAAGIALAAGLLKVARTMLTESLPYTADVTLDGRAVLFAAITCGAVALFIGALPALQSSMKDVANPLTQASRANSRGTSTVRRAIVVGELALSLVLVCSAFLLARTLMKLREVETGVRIDHVLTFSVDLPQQSYGTPERAAAFVRTASEKLRNIPGVTQAAVTTHLPLEWISNGEGIRVPGLEQQIRVRLKRVDPEYFRTFAIPLLQGREISSGDQLGSPQVVVVNQALASRLSETAGIRQPVGQGVQLSEPAFDGTAGTLAPVQIVGVIGNERTSSPGSPTPPVAYVPLAQVPRPQLKLVVRSELPPESLAGAVREAMREVDRNLPLGEMSTMEQLRDRSYSGTSRPAWLIGLFAGLAAVLSAVGLYSVMAQNVVQERRSIGIRLALGAQYHDVMMHVLRSAVIMLAIGVSVGFAGVVVSTRIMRSMLFEVSPLDPVALSLACATVAFLGLTAGLLPALRAARIDPVSTLHDEG